MNIEYRKDDKILAITQDENPESPREWDNLGTMLCFHRRYNLGDKDQPTYDCFNRFEEVEEYIMEEEKAVLMLPLYLYDHSGLRMKVGSFAGFLPQGHAEFDSGQVGYIYVSQETLDNEQVNKEKAKAILEGEVETYDQYLRGDIWGFTLYTVKTCNLGHEHREAIEGCWGFYGTDFEENGLFDSAGIDDIEDWKRAEE